MAKTIKNQEPVVTNPSIHPDDLLIQQWEQAQTVIEAYAGRVEAVAAALMALESQASQDDIEAAKSRFNAWLETEYPNRSARRGVALDIDINGFELTKHDLGDIAPAMLERAKEVLAGKLLVSGTEAMYKALVQYVCSARDEDGSPVLLASQQAAVTHLFFPAPVAATRTRVSKPKVDGESSAMNTEKKISVWPGTTVSANITHFKDKNQYMCWGRGKAKLAAELAAIGITVTPAMIDTWAASVGPTLFV